MKTIREYLPDFQFSGETVIADLERLWEDARNSCYLVADKDKRETADEFIRASEKTIERWNRDLETLSMPNDVRDVKNLVYTVIGGKGEYSSVAKQEAASILMKDCTKEELLRIVSLCCCEMFTTQDMQIMAARCGGFLPPDAPEVGEAFIKEWK